jgi:hypothetical protein
VKLNVHIEHLVIDDLGAGPLRRDRLRVAVHAEIERQLRLQGSSRPTGGQDSAQPVDGGQITYTGAPGAGLGAERIGRQVGRAVWRSVFE